MRVNLEGRHSPRPTTTKRGARTHPETPKIISRGNENEFLIVSYNTIFPSSNFNPLFSPALS